MIFMTLCPNCKTIQKAGNPCPLCKCPVEVPVAAEQEDKKDDAILSCQSQKNEVRNVGVYC